MAAATSTELALRAEVQHLKARLACLAHEWRASLTAVQEEKDRLAAVLGSISDEVWFADADGRLAFVNPRAVEEFRLGADRPAVDELAASVEVFGPDGSPRPVEQAPPLRALRGEVVRNQEEIVRMPGTGELRHRQVSAAPVRDASGNIIGSVSVVRDISDQKRAEEALQNQREWLRVTLHSIGDAVLATDVDGKITFLNPVASRLTGWPPADAAGRAAQEVFRIINEKTREAAEDIVLRVLHDQSPVALANHTALVSRDGRVIPIEDSAAPILDAAGRLAGVVLVFHDVTEKRLRQAALAAAHESAVTEKNRLTALMEALPVGVALIDPQGGNIASNRQFEQIWGGTPPPTRSVADYASYQAWWTSTRQPVRPEEWASARAVQHGETITNQEIEIQRFDGTRAFVLNSAAPIRDSQGRIVGSAVAIKDITDLKNAERLLEEREAVMRSFFDSPGVMRGVAELVEGEIRHVSCNAFAAQVYGVDRESIAGKTVLEAGGTEEIARLWASLYAHAFQTHKPVSMEYPRPGGNGGQRWLLGTAAYLGTGPSGHPRFGYTCLDITERKNAEDALRLSEAQFRTLANAIPQLCWMANADGSIYWYNDRWYDYTGTTPAQMEGWGWQSVHDPDVLPGVLERWKNSIATGEPFDMVFPLRGADGTFRPFLTRIMPVRDADGQVSRWFGTNTDISEQRKSEEVLAASERLYRAIGESIDYGVWVCDPDGRNTYASESYLKLVGRSQEQCAGFGWAEVLHPDDAERTLAAWKECVRTEGRWDMEQRVRGVDGQWHPVLARGVPVRDARGRIICWAGINLDISALKRAEEETRRTNAVLEAFFAASPGILNIEDDAFRYIKTDRLTPTYFGLTRETIIGRSISDLAPEFVREFGPMMREVIETGQPRLNMEVRSPVPGRSGEMAHWLASYFPVPLPDGRSGLGVVGIEITEIKKAEERLRQAQKLESLGLLAGGVAHDFNNLLVGIIGNASLAQEMLPPDHPVAALLEGVLKTGEQAAHLTRQMLAYSGKGRFIIEALDISAVIRDTSDLIRPSISRKAGLYLELEPNLPAVEADRGQVQQIVMNLVINASEAMGNSDGVITVRTRTELVDRSYVQSHPAAAELTEGEYVALEVEDTGCGMDETVKAKIFDPFFTTKFTGRGLGLAAVAGIVRAHKGAILVTSEPGRGTAFTVLLPASDRAVGRSASAVAAGTAVRGSEVVLVIDDEPVVRDMAKNALERHGYKVLVAYGGMAAIEILKRHPEEIAVAILDLSMPGMSGEETLPMLRQVRPQVKVLVSSGFSEAEAMSLFKGQSVSGFIQKPYTSAALAEKVRSALARLGEPGGF
jgi:two-component system cell cycle sensor histidine kinase/response regulator CckA